MERALRVPVALALLLELAAADPIELVRQRRDPVSRPAYETGNCQTASSSDSFLAKRTDHERRFSRPEANDGIVRVPETRREYNHGHAERDRMGWSRGACYRRIRLRSLHVTISSGSVPVPDCTPSYVVATWIDVFDGGCGAATTRTTPSLAEGLEAEIQGKLHLDPAA